MITKHSPERSFQMLIGGELVTGDGGYQVDNPATEAVVAVAPSCSRAQLDGAVTAAREALATWTTNDDQRREVLRACARVLEASREELAALLTAEQGKPMLEARIEVMASQMWFEYYAELEIPRQVIQDDATARIEVIGRPLGVVGAITPWNFPLGLAAWKVAPAMRAGNTVVLKPSPFTPLTTLRFGELVAEHVTAGVLNVLSGGDELGQWLTEHPVPQKLSFTGSVETGRLVGAAAGRSLKRATLELGGNDAAIVLPDADPKTQAEAIFWGAFVNNGQVCTAIKRLLVPESLHDEMVEALVAIASAAVVGDGSDPTSQLGPLCNQPQFERVQELVADAEQQGARIATGGKVAHKPGFFYAPTIVTDARRGMRLVDEEQFGPVLPVMSYRTVDEAIAIANDTPFGLSGSVWGTDLDAASAVAAQLECGTAWVNTHTALRPDQPFGGRKCSGVGVENGLAGFYQYCDLQVVHRPGASV